MSNYNLWEHKPWWCQPWTIVLTGIALVAGSWLLFNSWWLTIPIGLIITVWWVYFLILVPRMLAAPDSDRVP